MPVEIERKFLVVGSGWRDGGSGDRYCQGYLSNGGGPTVRVRRAADRAYITVKGDTVGIARAEYEYEIPVRHAEEMLATLCRHPLVEKTRHTVRYAGCVWTVDVFGGRGLVLAEIELKRSDAPVELPPWVGAEVTDDPRYRNSALAEHPMPA